MITTINAIKLKNYIIDKNKARHELLDKIEITKLKNYYKIIVYYHMYSIRILDECDLHLHKVIKELIFSNNAVKIQLGLNLLYERN
jgi:hypothetical protein